VELRRRLDEAEALLAADSSWRWPPLRDRLVSIVGPPRPDSATGGSSSSKAS